MKTALTEEQRKRFFYMKWTATSEAAQKLRAPYNYSTLRQNPSHFKKVREAFHLAWITHKMLGE